MKRNFVTWAFVLAMFGTIVLTPTFGQDFFKPGMLLTVNDSGDGADAVAGDSICATSDGRCTLRAAIEEANIEAGVSDVIMFALPQPAVIELTFGEIPITHGLEIVGPGARRLTIRRSTQSGTPNFRIFHTFSPAYVTIRGITLQNGSSDLGGGLFVESTTDNAEFVRLFDAALIGNHATNGGAAGASGKLYLVRCLIASNTATDGGGAFANIGSTAFTAITSSTLTGNSAAQGGAIQNESGSMILVNDTISGNSASSAASSIDSGAAGNTAVLNTIVGRDTGTQVSALQGSFQSAGNNIVTNVGKATGFINGVNGDQVSQNNLIDPKLGPLTNNEGQTDTMALLPGSPAIGNANVCATFSKCAEIPNFFIYGYYDQRHFWRRDLTTPPVDIGAVESDGVSPLLSNGGVTTYLGNGTRFGNSPVILIYPTTLAKYYSVVRSTGIFNFTDIPYTDAYVFDIRAKRAGVITPSVLGND